ncbi:MAG: hypothetical protein CSA36_02545 [Draconibacterium sp.]|nr:MAG: hypothetical protein CSA36_02545 [Draconibacterium sp.]
MIFHFQITSQESKNFQLGIKLSDNHTFFNFHSIIQKSLGYESHQLASFFISDSHWHKLREISMLDLGMNGAAYNIMQKTKVGALLNSKGQKLIYTFDFLNDRFFLIELIEIIMDQNLSEPLVSSKYGDVPAQVLGDDYNTQETAELVEEEVYMDFGELEDYTEIFGEMDDF